MKHSAIKLQLRNPTKSGTSVTCLYIPTAKLSGAALSRLSRNSWITKNGRQGIPLKLSAFCLLPGHVMVHARSCSFQRTIKGWLRQSLQWWLTHHCSVPPLPPATLVGLISELRWNTSSTPIPPTNLHSYHCHYQPAPCAIYRSTTRAPPRSTLHTCSMFQANHIVHAPVLEVMGLGHHKDLHCWHWVVVRATADDLVEI